MFKWTKKNKESSRLMHYFGWCVCYHVSRCVFLCFISRLLWSLSALFTSALIISLVFAIIPLCHHVILLSIAMGVAGKAMGVIDTIGNLQLVKLYQKDSAIFLQVRCECAWFVFLFFLLNFYGATGGKKRYLVGHLTSHNNHTLHSYYWFNMGVRYNYIF